MSLPPRRARARGAAAKPGPDGPRQEARTSGEVPSYSGIQSAPRPSVSRPNRLRRAMVRSRLSADSGELRWLLTPRSRAASTTRLARGRRVRHSARAPSWGRPVRAESRRQDGAVLDRLARPLAQVGEHRVRRVAEEVDPASVQRGIRLGSSSAHLYSVPGREDAVAVTRASWRHDRAPPPVALVDPGLVRWSSSSSCADGVDGSLRAAGTGRGRGAHRCTLWVEGLAPWPRRGGREPATAAGPCGRRRRRTWPGSPQRHSPSA